MSRDMKHWLWGKTFEEIMRLFVYSFELRFNANNNQRLQNLVELSNLGSRISKDTYFWKENRFIRRLSWYLGSYICCMNTYVTFAVWYFKTVMNQSYFPLSLNLKHWCPFARWITCHLVKDAVEILARLWGFRAAVANRELNPYSKSDSLYINQY